ncbi:MAG: glycerol-3-phosphate dehydrogenase/oxidase [Opitutus sp.]
MSTSRVNTLQRFRNETFDVLVVGGGIVGAGVARDAAQRGLTVALVDRHDFAFGTSSRSSRLLHGGLRYLEQGHIKLVREASREKTILRDIAPNLGEPLGFVFPAYRRNGRPLWQLKIGVRLYDLLCNGKNFGRSRGLTRHETLQLLPGLDTAGLLGSVQYYDALTNDSRLVIDTLRSAAQHGAAVCNYVRFLKADHQGPWACSLRDESSGEVITVRARTVVNATGPWAPEIERSQVKLRLSKGIHLVLEKKRLGITAPLVLAEGSRILFVIPWGERVIIGTTDTDYTGRPEDVAVDPNDVEYVLNAVNMSFPTLKLSESDVISTWAGVRPLIADPNGAPSDISRAHEIHTPEPGWWDVAGGKLTTYRLMAEHTVDQLCRHLGGGRLRCRTAATPLLSASDRRFSSVVPPPITREAVAHYVLKEWALTVEDVMIRRSSWGLYHSAALARTDEVAGWIAQLLAGNAKEEARGNVDGIRPAFPTAFE